MDATLDWVFFVDRCLGRRIIPEMLRSAGEIVRAHDEVFRQDTRDEKWLTEVGKNGWIVLTKDKNIRYRAIELQALLAAKVRAFVLTAMKKLCKTTGPPFIAHVSRDGSVTLVKN